MQIPCDAGSLGDALFQTHVEVAPHVLQTQLIKHAKQCQKSGGARHAEPGGLVIRRGDGEIEGCAGLIPHAAVVAGDHAEAVVARRKIRIECLPAIAHVLPFAIVAFQHVAKTHSFPARRGLAPCSRSPDPVSAAAAPCRPLSASKVLRSAMICSICTGGGSLLNGRCRGSTTLTPSPGRNQILPSVDLATCPPK